MLFARELVEKRVYEEIERGGEFAELLERLDDEIVKENGRGGFTLEKYFVADHDEHPEIVRARDPA